MSAPCEQRRFALGDLSLPARFSAKLRYVAIDRPGVLRNGEKLLREGKLDAAIAEYLRVVEDQPRDWSTANVLGDLYLRAGHVDQLRLALVMLGERDPDRIIAERLSNAAPDETSSDLKTVSGPPVEAAGIGNDGDVWLIPDATGVALRIAALRRPDARVMS